MEKPMGKFSIEFKWGAIFMAMSLLWTYLERSAGLHGDAIAKYPLLSNIFALFAFALYFMAVADKKQNYYHGKMDWTRGFLSGLSLTVVLAILNPLTQYVALNYVSPEFLANMRAFYVTKGALSPAAAESMFSLKSLVLQGIFTILSMGVVTSAIIAWFVRSKDYKQ